MVLQVHLTVHWTIKYSTLVSVSEHLVNSCFYSQMTESFVKFPREQESEWATYPLETAYFTLNLNFITSFCIILASSEYVCNLHYFISTSLSAVWILTAFLDKTTIPKLSTYLVLDIHRSVTFAKVVNIHFSKTNLCMVPVIKF